MRIALVVVALVACKAKEKPQPAPLTVETKIDLGSATAPMEASPFAGMPNCLRYQKVIDRLTSCDKVAADTKKALQDGYDAMKSSMQYVTDDSRRAMDDGCKQAADAMTQAVASLGCEMLAEAGGDVAGSRDVPSEKGVPLDRAVLGSMPRPFGALQPIKPTMTRDEILAVIPDARRDGEDIVVPLGAEALTAKILIDANDHISDITISMTPFPSELFQQAWGESPTNVWLDRKAMWRVDYGGDDGALHIFPYKQLVDVVGAGPDLLADATPLIGQPIAKLKAKLGGRLDEWTDTDEDGEDITRPRVLLPSTDVCHFDTMYLLIVENEVVTGATLTQCYDGDSERKTALAAMEKRWGRAIPTRTADDRLVYRFSRPGRMVEMTEDDTVDPAGAWIVKIRRVGSATSSR